ncbi:ABC transporter substrate-binding protein [Ammonifex thiophilus]|uniref:ABC transporter substrate-binding protein n=1 Tax=Ammonifex thiophilus TaxID=444093 RepID=A0A3D8P4S5_9THEO|nr:ABC transporter substrate-binding protein [Ammonifex thiophilus]RDV82539.1 ABC transporter substrate-binding protein [Ammonifex thiophilus]
MRLRWGIKGLLGTLLLLGLIAGCGKSQPGAVAEKAQKITITDSYGRQVEVVSPPTRIVSLNPNVTEMLYILGAGERIIAVSEGQQFPPQVRGKETVGPTFTPSAEKIIALRPDAVFAYGPSGGPALKKEIAEQLEAAGIPLIYLDLYKPQTFSSDVRTLAKIVNQEKKAEDYLAVVDKYRQLIKERIGRLKPEAKVRVYLEGRTGDYVTYSKGSGGDERVTLAGGINVAANEPGKYPRVSPEWVLQKNPQVIVKEILKDKAPMGYGVTDTKKLEEIRAALMRRPGWDKLEAVKQGRVYLVSTEISGSPRDIVLLCYYAKWFYPELFTDLDPQAVHRELLTKFYGVEPRGVWVYPEK